MTDPLEFRIQDYDEDGTLRVGLLLWAVILMSSRHVLLRIVAGLSAFVGVDSASLAQMYAAPWFLTASMPALVVAVAAVRRGPKAGKAVRWIWRRGRGWLALATVADALLLAVHILGGRLILNEWYLLWFLFDAYLLAYLVRSRRVKRVFADFPAPAGAR